MRVDGDETKALEKTAPFKYKVRDHANRASFKTSPTWSNLDKHLKWQMVLTTSAELFLEIFFFFRN